VEKVVRGVQAAHVLEGLLPSLGVTADSLEIRGTQIFPETQIRPPKHGELLQRLSNVRLRVTESIRPEVLIVPGDRRAIV
jgi:hypothetical protein